MTLPERHGRELSRGALRFFLIALLMAGTAAGIAWLLIRLFGRPSAGAASLLSPVFALSSLSLLAGSFSLQRAVVMVRREKQQLFRRWLGWSLLYAALFLGIQSYALWRLFPPERTSDDASLGARGYVLALASLHALHFLVAALFLAFVAARTTLDRYDHEYYWGVTVCAWFWHVLGIVWIGILCVLVIAAI